MMITAGYLHYKWGEFNFHDGGFIRIDMDLVLESYLGFQDINQKTFMVLSKAEPKMLPQSKSIVVNKGKRADGRWTLTFTLMRLEQENVFETLCADIIMYYAEAKEEQEALHLIEQRYKQWNILLQNYKNGKLYQEIEMSIPCADLVDVLRSQRERIRKYRFLIFTDADMSATIKSLDNKHEWMAHSSIHQMSVILHQVFDLAVEDGHMKFNPTESKRLFMKGTKQKREALRDCDVKEIMDKLSLLEAKDRIPLAILLYTGVRRGEALGLRWENLDWKKGVIHIEQAVTFLNNQPVLGETKSDAGIRTVPFDERLMDVLRPYRQIVGFIVGDGITPMTERTFTRMWQRIDRTIDLHGATPHTFRHTYITLAASSGIDVKTLQSIAGHSDIKMTMDRYAHKRDEKIIEAGSRIGGVFSSL